MGAFHTKEQWINKLLESGIDLQTALSVYEKTNLHRNANKNFGGEGNFPIIDQDLKNAEFENKTKKINISPKQKKIIELSLDLQENSAKKVNKIGYISTTLIQCSLPHSNPKAAFYRRTNGRDSISLVNDPKIGIPYGKIPRLILIYICSEITRNKSQLVFLGKNFTEFAIRLGLTSTTGGKNGSITQLKSQAKKLFTSKISVINESSDAFEWENMFIVDKGKLFFNSKNPSWESHILISESFYQDVLQHSAPIDMRVVQMLRSTLEIDIYIWLSYRLNAITRPLNIKWDQLMWQFHKFEELPDDLSLTAANQEQLKDDYKKNQRDILDFKKKFKHACTNILNIWSGHIDCVYQPKGILLYPSKKPMLPKNSL